METKYWIIFFFFFSCWINSGETLRPPKNNAVPDRTETQSVAFSNLLSLNEDKSDLNSDSNAPTSDISFINGKSLPIGDSATNDELQEVIEQQSIPSRRNLLQRRGKKPPSDRRRRPSKSQSSPAVTEDAPAVGFQSDTSSTDNRSTRGPARPVRRNRPSFRQRNSPSTASLDNVSVQPDTEQTNLSDGLNTRTNNRRRNRPATVPRRSTVPVTDSANVNLDLLLLTPRKTLLTTDTLREQATDSTLFSNTNRQSLIPQRLNKFEQPNTSANLRSPTEEISAAKGFQNLRRQPGFNSERSSAVASRPARVTPASTARAPPPATAPPQSESNQKYDTECPEKNGYFADAFQCDRYYQCSNYELKERLCPDGLVFNDFSTKLGRCDFMHAVNCTGREELQAAKPVGPCPRQNGYYPDRDASVCDRFVQCVDGKANPLVCPSGLVFSLKTGTCLWPDQAGRNGCGSQDVLRFECPFKEGVDVRTLLPGQPLHPRFPDPADCQFFITCIEGVTPRRQGCQQGQVFNPSTKACDELKNVPECN